jgi:putative transcriptional regulator
LLSLILLYIFYTMQLPKLQIGTVLIADPFMEDDNFTETVVLLTDEETDGIYGFSINKKMALNLHEIIDDLLIEDIVVYYGGPVGLNAVQFIHNAPTIFTDAKKIMEGVYLGGDFDLLIQKINKQQIKPEQYKIMMGYCGWDTTQLLTEVFEEESWLTANINNSFILQQQTQNIYNDCKAIALQKN